MAQATTPTAVPATPPGALRVVLFGMPDAGKSSLLGSLAQAAQTQEHVLGGRLIDKTQGLVELQRRVYEERPRETLAELAPYPVTLEPFPPRGAPASAVPPPVEAVLYDCDGRVANELLDRQHAPEDFKGDRALARAVLDADTLILVVDAAADPAVVQRDFAQFAHFLRLLEQTRGRRTEVGGLPVYLVLTKCDLLARQGDSMAAWMDRIEERKRQVDKSFQDFLAKQARRDHMPFGKIDLHLWATAVKRPPLQDAPPRPREPYGVAELFRQALESAATYRAHRDRARGRLQLTLAVLLGLLTGLALLVLLLYFSRPSEDVAKLGKGVTALRQRMGGTAADRLRGATDDRIKELQEVRANPVYPQLREEDRRYVEQALKELGDFVEFRDRLKAVGAQFGDDVRFIRDEDKLRQVKEALAGVEPPPAYREEWAKTEEVRKLARWAAETAALERAVEETRAKYTEVLAEGRKLQALRDKGTITIADLRQQVAKVWNQVKALRAQTGDGAGEVPGTSGLTYAQVLQFPSVAAVYQEWRDSRLEMRLEEWSK